MKFPCLVAEWTCTTPIKLYIELEGVTEEGAPKGTVTAELMGNFQDSGRIVYTEDQKQVYTSGRAYFQGDVFPEIPNITGGRAEVHGETREIHRGYKRRNPDGSVNYTEIEFK